jgi:hypothetical protein
MILCFLQTSSFDLFLFQLLDNIEEFLAYESATTAPLPRIQVRESKTDAFQVLRAEQTVMSMRSKLKKRISKAAS